MIKRIPENNVPVNTSVNKRNVAHPQFTSYAYKPHAQDNPQIANILAIIKAHAAHTIVTNKTLGLKKLPASNKSSSERAVTTLANTKGMGLKTLPHKKGAAVKTPQENAFASLAKILGVNATENATQMPAKETANAPEQKGVEAAIKRVDPKIKHLVDNITPAPRKQALNFHVTPKSNPRTFTRDFPANKVHKNNPSLSILHFPPTPVYIQQIKDHYKEFGIIAHAGEFDCFSYVHDLVIKHKRDIVLIADKFEYFLLFQNSIPRALSISFKKNNAETPKELFFRFFIKAIKDNVQNSAYKTIPPNNDIDLKSLSEIEKEDAGEFGLNMPRYFKQCIQYLHALELR